MIPPGQAISFTHKLMAPPAAPQVSGRVIQASVWIPRSIHWLCVWSRLNAKFTWNIIYQMLLLNLCLLQMQIVLPLGVNFKNIYSAYWFQKSNNFVPNTFSITFPDTNVTSPICRVPSQRTELFELSKLWYRAASGPVHAEGLFQVVSGSDGSIKLSSNSPEKC